MGISRFFQLTKVDPIKGFVTGIAACEEPDKSGEIFDYDSSKPHFEQWSGEISKATKGENKGNVREMHGKVAAGKLTDIKFDDPAKSIEVTAKIVDDGVLKKLSEGVYTGFSIGGDYEKKWKDGDLVRYTARPNEISVVDNPCMPSAHFSIVKEDGSTEMRKFTTPAAARKGVTQKWEASDGKTFEKKADAEAHDEQLAKVASDPAAKLSAAVASVTSKLEKAESSYAAADSAADASEEVLEMKDIESLPQIVRAAMADSDTAEVFRRMYNKARAEGMGPVEALNDAWGKVVDSSERTIDGKYKITGELDAFVEDKSPIDVGDYGKDNVKASGLAPGAKSQLEGLLGRNAPRPEGATVGKREFSSKERDAAADSGEALPDGSYPIKNTSDLGNAIQAYGRAKNKVKVKAHIKTRAKALGAEGQLPNSWKDGADKAARADELCKGLLYQGKRVTKGLWEVCDLAQLIMSLESLQERTEYEAAREGDASPVPANLKQDIASLASCLREMVEEETNELLDDDEMIDFGELLEMSAGNARLSALAKVLGVKAPKTLAKAHSKSQAGHITAAHDYLAKAGAACPHGEAAEGMDGADGKDGAEKVAKAGARHSAADQAHLDSAHEHLGKMGYCAKADGGKDGDGEAEKMAKGISKGDQVHLDTAHDHISKMGVGCGMAKAGARHSKDDLAHLTKAHDHMAAAGADCAMKSEGVMDGKAGEHADGEDGHDGADGADGADGKNEKAAKADLIKALADKNALIDRLEKAANEATAAYGALLKRVEMIESQEVPDPARRTFHVVNKGEEEAREARERLRKMAKENPRALAAILIQDAQQHPIDVNQVGSK